MFRISEGRNHWFRPFAPILIFVLALPLPGQTGNRDSVDARVNNSRIRINYGRPALDGRKTSTMLTNAPVGTVWRLGTGQATELSTSAALSVGGRQLAAGRYSLWGRKTGERQWVLSFHPQTDIPGSPEVKDGFLADAALQVTEVDTFNEQLLIMLTPHDDHLAIAIYWGSTKLETEIVVLR